MRDDLIRCSKGHFHMPGQACKPRPARHATQTLNGLVRFTLDLRLPNPLYDWMCLDAEYRKVSSLHSYVSEVLEVWVTSRGGSHETPTG